MNMPATVNGKIALLLALKDRRQRYKRELAQAGNRDFQAARMVRFLDGEIALVRRAIRSEAVAAATGA